MIQTGQHPLDGGAPAVAIPEPELREAPQCLTRRNVLLLEDDVMLLSLLEQHLQTLQMFTLKAESVAEAREVLTHHQVHLAIFDIHLPDGCGLQLCAEIDEHPRWSGLPVIVLSSATQADIVRRTRFAGARYFLSKPYDPNVLLALIELALDRQ